MTAESTRRFYARWARIYDLLAAAPGVGSWRSRAIDALDLEAGETVVEMGCGTGLNVPGLRERVAPGGRVVGVDLTREMLARARRRTGRRAPDSDAGPAVGYLQGDARAPPVRGVDAVLATFVVGIFEEAGAVVDRWCDLVGPGGRVALLNFQPSDRALAAPLNLAFEGFVRLSTPGERLARSRKAPAFRRRVRAGREALTARTVDRRFETLAGGYLGLLAGTVEA